MMTTTVMMATATANEKVQFAWERMNRFSDCLDCPPGRRAVTKDDVLSVLRILTTVGVRKQDVIRLVRNGTIRAEHPNAFRLDGEGPYGFGTCIGNMAVFIAMALCILGRRQSAVAMIREIFTPEGVPGLWLAYQPRSDSRRSHICLFRHYSRGGLPTQEDAKLLYALGAALAEVSSVPVSVEIRIDDQEFGF